MQSLRIFIWMKHDAQDRVFKTEIYKIVNLTEELLCSSTSPVTIRCVYKFIFACACAQDMYTWARRYLQLDQSAHNILAYCFPHLAESNCSFIPSFLKCILGFILDAA